jgi:hypothetical protein
VSIIIKGAAAQAIADPVRSAVQLPITDVVVGDRHRKDMGDVAGHYVRAA